MEKFKPIFIIGGFIVAIFALFSFIGILTMFDYSTFNLFGLVSELLYPIGFMLVAIGAIYIGMKSE